MEFITYFIDLFLNLDKHLVEAAATYGTWIYLILFIIIFCETGLVITPILPGDSLLFAAGTLCALGGMNIWILFGLLTVAAILGDGVNYHIGRFLGLKAFSPNARFLKTAYLDKTHQFYEKYGGKTIIAARFVPIVRTFAPFVAGTGSMTYRNFMVYNVAGAILWVSTMLGSGYIFGNIPFIRNNFSLVVLVIIGISVLPMAIEIVKTYRARQKIA